MEHGIMRWGDDEPHRFVHDHSDVGGGYCDCGAQRCCLPECDGWCKHPGEWVEKAELDERRATWVETQLKADYVLLQLLGLDEYGTRKGHGPT